MIGGHAWSRAAIAIASHLYAELYVENGEPHESRINPTEVAERPVSSEPVSGSGFPDYQGKNREFRKIGRLLPSRVAKRHQCQWASRANSLHGLAGNFQGRSSENPRHCSEPLLPGS